MWQLEEQGELSNIVIMVDTRIRVARVLNGLIDLIGEETKRFGGSDGGRDRVNQSRRFQSNEFFVRGARIFEHLKNTE